MSTVSPARHIEEEPTSTPSSIPSTQMRSTNVPLRTAIAIMSGQFEFARGGSNAAYLDMQGITSDHEMRTAPVDETCSKDYVPPQIEYIVKPRIRPKDMRAVARIVSSAMCGQDSENPLKHVDMKSLRRDVSQIAAMPDYAQRHAAFDAMLMSMQKNLGLPMSIEVRSVRLTDKYYRPKTRKVQTQTPQLKIV